MQLRIEIQNSGEIENDLAALRNIAPFVMVNVAWDHLRFAIDNHSFYALPVLKIPRPQSGVGIFREPALVSVIPVNNGDVLTKGWLEAYINRALDIDDVSRPEFFSRLLFSGAEKAMVTIVQPTTFPPLGTEGNSVFLSDCGLSTATLALLTPGPYIIANNTIWRAYRLFDDSNGAFMVSCKPNLTPLVQSFQNLRISGEVYQTISVAVASKLPAAVDHPCSKYSLYGKRVAVKDIYQITGLKTSLCNKAYYDLSLPASFTAPTVQRLIDAGAQIVGKTKLSSLISREEPTEAVDYPTPFNPRGEGYQSPAGSSSGSAAAIAAYEWLDFAIGSDTTGSGRRPALVNGIFSLRPSHDILSLDGIVPTFSAFDTPCFFGRNIKTFSHFAQTWFGNEYIEKPLTLPPILIYPTEYLPVPNVSQMQMLDLFVKDMEKLHNVRATKLSISALWEKSAPQEAQSLSVREYLKDAGTNSFIYEFYHSTDQFRAEYLAKYHKKAFVNSFVQWRWELGKSITKVQRDEAVHRLEVYKTWFLEHVLQVGLRSAMVFLPIANIEPNYRDTPPGEPFSQSGFDPLFLSPLLGAPEFVVPIGQLPYDSRISGREEQLPVALSILSAPGTDLWLINTVRKCLEVSGRSTTIKTGSNAF